MKNALIIVLAVLLLISAGFNVKLCSTQNQSKDNVDYVLKMKTIPGLEGTYTGNLLVGNIFTSELKDFIIFGGIYEPGTKSSWHNTNKEQINYVVSGEGYYQERNKPVKKVKAGDIFITAEGVESWHGSTHDKRMELLVFSHYGKNLIEWLEPVNDIEYESLE